MTSHQRKQARVRARSNRFGGRRPLVWITCRHCGDVAPLDMNEEFIRIHLAAQLCRRCHFWVEKVERRDEARSVRVDGRHFRIREDFDGPGFRGHGGTRFTIRFHDGREVATRNLWSQGDIPEEWRAELPDNAVFMPWWYGMGREQLEAFVALGCGVPREAFEAAGAQA